MESPAGAHPVLLCPVLGELGLHQGPGVHLTSRGCVGVALLIVATASSHGVAQEPGSPHQGFWIGFGVGGGYHLSGPTRARGGGAGQVRLGGTLASHLLVGLELTGWGREQNQTTALRGNMMGTAILYPAGIGAFVKAGFGLATESLASSPAGPGSITRAGLGSSVGAGYDVRIGDNLFLTASLDFLLQVISDRTASLALLTFGVTWH